MTPEHPLARLEDFQPTGLQPDAELAEPILRAFGFDVQALRMRLAGRPYLALPHLDGRAGYALIPDRAQRFADRQETMTP